MMKRARVVLWLLVLGGVAIAVQDGRVRAAIGPDLVKEGGPLLRVGLHRLTDAAHDTAQAVGLHTRETPAQARARIDAEKAALNEQIKRLRAKGPGSFEESMKLYGELSKLDAIPDVGEPPMRLAAIGQGDVFGYDAALTRGFEKYARATAADVAKRSPPFSPAATRVQGAKYLDRILAPKRHEVVDEDFALNASERAVLDQNGFVVTRRLGSASHAALMHTIYEHDQPLFVSADAVLHAWHMTYDAMLEELETTWLSNALAQMLAGMAEQVPRARALDHAPLSDGLRDADLFVAVARSLLEGDLVAGSRVSRTEVQRVFDAIKREERMNLELFGRKRAEDFSQMRPRGHYDKTEELRRYFRAMMWLGRTELRVAGPDSAPRELAAALVLNDLLVRSNQLERWREIDRLLQTFMGRSDSMGPPDVGALLALSSMTGAEAVRSDADLETLRQRILDTKLGAQQLNSQLRASDPASAERIELPRAFLLLGQRFVVDSWALSQLVYDRVVVDETKIKRTMPSGIDVAFSALGNDSVANLLAFRIDNEGGVKGRDGLPFQANLLATRDVVDARSNAAWEANLYDLWLATLRGLSEPTTDARFPTVMRTQAWSRRVLQAQLASWAELRHDTILYAKQSYGMGISCEYPTGFVELAPTFWRRLEQGTALAASLLERTSFPPEIAAVKENQVAMAKRFSATVSTLRGIVDRELASEPLTAEQERFLKSAVERKESGMCGEPPRWDGWYIQLYYRGQKDALKFDALVADVHTSPDDGILHVSTGPVALMVVVLERGGDTMAFSGPVSTYYEHVPNGGVRLTDREWKEQLARKNAPPAPEWTNGWIIGDLPAYLPIDDD